MSDVTPLDSPDTIPSTLPSPGGAAIPPSAIQADDQVLACLLFLARYFGSPVEAALITASVPLEDGKIDQGTLSECAHRAGLSATVSQKSASQVKASMLPAIIFAEDGDAAVVLHRKGNAFECWLPDIQGTKMIALDQLEADLPGKWFFLRPLLYFDKRGLLYYVPETTGWFWSAFRENRWIYGWGVVATAIANILAAAIPFYTMAVYDRVVPNNAINSLWVLTTAIVAIIVLDFSMRKIRSYLLESAARRMDLALSSRIFSQGLRVRAADRPASGGSLANLVRDFESVRDFFGSGTLTVLGDLPFVFLFASLLWWIGGWIGLVPLVFGLVALMGALLVQRRLARVLSANMEENTQRTAHLFEVMNGLDTVKALGGEAWARRKWEKLTVAISRNTMKMRQLTALGGLSTHSFGSTTTVMIVMFGALLIVEHELTLGQLIAMTMLSSRVFQPIVQFSGLLLRWQQTKLSLDAINSLMDKPVDDPASGIELPRIEGHVEFRDVTFAYQDGPPALKQVNLKIQPGERVGFIGRIGSGKSTMLRLLVNLYSTQDGAVLIDGLSVPQIEPHSLRRNMGYVPQDVLLYHGTIRENILLGSNHPSDQDLLDAIKLSCLGETLAQFPQGLGTQVGERGDRLSGGQRQTVTLARALVRRPRLLLLDEPTSMMDPATEQQLIANLRKLEDTTLLLVTHRMAMLPLVDRLVVLDKGKIALDGPRDEVLRRLSRSPAKPAEPKSDSSSVQELV